MFNELDTVTLTEPIAVKNTWHMAEHSPLRETIKSGVGLLPGDVGTIVLVQGDGEAFEVEFVMPDSCPAAIATVYPHQMRPATEEDLANDRFWQDAPDNEEPECSMSST